jgi:diguanylate cyclase (GGDEF)-like protein
VALVEVAVATVVMSAQSTPDALLGQELLQSLPTPQPTVVRPRVLAAYGSLMAAATLGILYLYRGRDFILYWLGSWLLLASGLAIVSQVYADERLTRVMIGLAVLLMVWAAGLVLLAVAAFPVHALRWNVPIRVGSVSAVWFLASPFLLPLSVIVWSGTAVALFMVGLAASEYLSLARRARHAGAFLIGSGLAVVWIVNAVGAAIVLNVVPWGELLNQFAVANVIMSILIALGMHVLVFEDMTDELRRANRDLAAANEEVKRLAITDPLTGCNNRRFFDEIERREMQRHRRYESPLSVVFVDVNHFKQLNDTLGHDTGDEVLRTIGAMLRRQVRESDYVIRWGGDEFLLLLNCGLAEAEHKAGELKLAFGRERLTAALPPSLGLSIGVAAVSTDADGLRDAIRVADTRMYRDKPAAAAAPTSSTSSTSSSPSSPSSSSTSSTSSTSPASPLKI